jgi:hypothetical protein
MSVPSLDPSKSGTALFIILIAVALFGALAYAVTHSGRGAATVDPEQVDLLAARIVQYSTAVSVAVQRMVLTGTALTDLDFTSDGPSGASAVFAPEGGGIPFQQLPPEAAGTYPDEATHWMFKPTSDGGAAGNEMPGVGSSSIGSHPAGDDILMIAYEISADVCNAINRRLGEPYDAVPAFTTDLAFGLWITMSALELTSASCAGCVGRQFLCVRNASSSIYAYYHVLYQQ